MRGYLLEGRLLGQHIVVEINVQGIFILFKGHNGNAYHSLSCDVRILSSYLVNFSIQHIWRERNMRADYELRERKPYF